MSFSFRFLKNPLYRFLLSALGIYILWYILYELWLHPKEQIDIWIIKETIRTSIIILKWIGYTTFSGSDRLIGIDGTSGLWVGDNCDSIELFALFTGFILAFPGFWVKKIWFIPLGIFIIFFANVFRLIGLSIIQKNFSQKWLEFNHTYTFTVLVYGIIFLLWFGWVKRIVNTTTFLPNTDKK